MTKTLLTSEQRKDAGLVKYEQDLQAAYARQARTEILTNMLGKTVRISLCTEYSYITVNGTLEASRNPNHYAVNVNTAGTLNFVRFSVDSIIDAYDKENGVNVITLR